MSSSSAIVLSDDERKERVARLTSCFALCDLNEEGVIDSNELAILAKAINPNTINIQQEVNIVMKTMDTKMDGIIDLEEWIQGLMNMFQFMNRYVVCHRSTDVGVDCDIPFSVCVHKFAGINDIVTCQFIVCPYSVVILLS